MNLIFQGHKYVRTQHHEETGLQNISHLRVKTVSILINVQSQHASWRNMEDKTKQHDFSKFL